MFRRSTSLSSKKKIQYERSMKTRKTIVFKKKMNMVSMDLPLIFQAYFNKYITYLLLMSFRR